VYATHKATPRCCTKHYPELLTDGGYPGRQWNSDEVCKRKAGGV
jgi:hypothetical protein